MIVRLCVKVVTAVALALAGSSHTPADARPSDGALRTALQTDLNTYLKVHGVSEHVSAASLSVSLRGRSNNTMNLSAGTVQYGGRTPVPSNSLWQIGSNTKAFTATTMLQLEAAHKLSIKDTVGKWLPQYPAWRDIMIERLLNMTSGIATYDERRAFRRAYAAAPTTDFSKERLVSFAAGVPLQRGYNYTNTGYILAEMIIEKATNDTYAHQLMKRFIKPLALNDLFYRANVYPRSVIARMPAGYFFVDTVKPFAKLLGTNVNDLGLSWTQAAGGIVSSTDDLTKWTRALYGGGLLPPPQQRELESLVSVKTGRPIARTSIEDPQGFALGVAQSTKSRLGTFWYYEGGTFGYRVLHLYLPRSGAIIAVALNSNAKSNAIGSGLALSVYKTLHDAPDASEPESTPPASDFAARTAPWFTVTSATYSVLKHALVKKIWGCLRLCDCPLHRKRLVHT